MDIEKALGIIAKTKEENKSSLKFYNMGMTDEDLQVLLPIIIKDLPNLTSLDLGKNELTSIPKEIGKLKNLVTLYLDKNKFESLPDEITELTELKGLNLDNNLFKNIPNGIMHLKKLKELFFGNNQLTSIPKEIGELRDLMYLTLNKNELTSIPKEIGELKNLVKLYLDNNKLESLPDEIRELTELMRLNLDNNLFKDIPNGIMHLKKLKELFLGNNQLTSIPKEIAKLPELKFLDSSHNKITDLPEILILFNTIFSESRIKINVDHNPLSAETIYKTMYARAKDIDYKTIITQNLIRTIHKIFDAKRHNHEYLDFGTMRISDQDLQFLLPLIIKELPNLKVFNLGHNQLSRIPKEIGELVKLEKLYLGVNQISSIPEEISELKNLKILQLKQNQLRSIPKEIGELKNLKKLQIKQNQLSSIPKEIGELQNLKKLQLKENQLSSIPEEIRELKNLKTLDINSNLFTSIPEVFGTLTTLEVLNVSSNQITSDKVPNAIGNLINLKDLDVSDNQLNSIPEVFGKLKNLETLKANDNQITSNKVPNSISNLVKLNSLNVSKNQLNSIPEVFGSLTNLETLEASSNQITSDKVPNSISDLINLKYLDISDNRLNSIPEVFGSLTMVETLKAYNNQITSNNVPNTIGNLVNLNFLHLSNNELDSIPEVFGSLTKLKVLNVNHNQISQLPETLPIYYNSSNRIYLNHNPLTEETINRIELRVTSALRCTIDFSRIEPYVSILNRIYKNISTEIQNRIATLTKKEYTISNGDRSILETGTYVIKKFLEKTKLNSLPKAIADVVLKHYIDTALSTDEITKKNALSEMATALGNCPTPVYSLIVNKAIGLAKEDSTLFKDKALLDAILEKMALEAYLAKHFKPLKDTKEKEYIERLHGFVNSIYLKDAVNLPYNIIKISIPKERTWVPSTSAHTELGFEQIKREWVEPFAKICCKTNAAGVLKIDTEGKFELDQKKLDVIKQQFMIDNNLGDSATNVAVTNFNKKCNAELMKYRDLFTVMPYLSEVLQKMLDPDEINIVEQLVINKREETTEKIVENCFITYCNTIEKVLASEECKELIAKTISEEQKEQKSLERFTNPIIDRKTSNPRGENTQQTQRRTTRTSSGLSF